MDIVKFLRDKLSTSPQTVTQTQMKAATGSKEQMVMLSKFGVVTDDLRAALSNSDMINFERSSLYTSIDRSLVHPIMSGAAGIYSDVACLTANTEIPLLDGRVLTIEKLLCEYNEGKENWVYSCDTKGSPKAEKINWVVKQPNKKETLRVHLDNGKFIEASTNHEFIKRTGELCRTDELKVNDSLLPFHRVYRDSNSKIVKIENIGEQEVYDLNINGSHLFALDCGVYVHNSSYNRVHNATVWVTAKNKEYQYQIEKLFEIVNLEENIYDLCWSTATFGDLFWRIFAEPGLGVVSIDDTAHPITTCLRGSTKINLFDNSTPTIQEMFENRNKYIGKDIYCCSESGGIRATQIKDVLKTRLNATYVRVHLDSGEYFDCTPDHKCMLRTGKFKEAKDLKPFESLMPLKNNGVLLNHKVDRIEYLDVIEDAYDLTVAGVNPTFPLSCGVFVHNSRIDYNGKLIGFFQTPGGYASQADRKLEAPWDYCVVGSTKIPLLNGSIKSPTIQEMAENEKDYIGKSIYSINPLTKALEPDKILHIKKTKLNTSIVRVWLDNNEYIDCTPNHRFMLRDGSYKEAESLTEGQSLMPFYTKFYHYVKNKCKDYKLVYDPSKDGYRYIHRLVSSFYDGPCKRGEEVVHHKDFVTNPLNKLNNDPLNLQKVTKEEHEEIHFHGRGNVELCNCCICKQVKNKVNIELRLCSECFTPFECKSNSTQKTCGTLCANKLRATNKTIVREIRACACGCGETFEIRPKRKTRFIKGHYKHVNLVGNRNHKTDCKCTVCLTTKGERPYDNSLNSLVTKECKYCKEILVDIKLSQYMNHVKKCKELQPLLNHKVVKVEKLSDLQDTYDLETERNHNFAVEAGVFIHNCHFRLLGAKRRRPQYGASDSNFSEYRTVSIMAPDVRRLTSKYGTCLPSTARVHLKNGTLAIGDIVNCKLNVEVKTLNESTGEIEYKKVIGFKSRENHEPLVLIGYASGYRRRSLSATSNHPIATPNGWIPIGNIKVGDYILVESPTLSKDQEQIILGTMLGDAHFKSLKNKGGYNLSSYTFGQSKYITYFNWIKDNLKNLNMRYGVRSSGSMKNSFKSERHLGKKLNFKDHHFVQSKALPILESLYALCCVNGKKKVTRELLDKIEPLGLATWFMDDGSVQYISKNKENVSCIICTDSFSLKENKIIAKWFKEKYGIIVNIKKTGGVVKGVDQHRIYFPVGACKKLREIISPYLVFDLSAKSSKNRKSWISESIEQGKEDGVIPVKVTTKGIVNHKGNVFDIEIDGNHNFLVGEDAGIVVHNSVLSDALPIFKRLRLAEDSVLMARITRGVLRYMYKIGIDKSNSNNEAVGSLIDSYVSTLKEARCVRGNTQIALLNGTNPTIQEMAENKNEYIGKSVYSVNPLTKAIEPDKIINVAKTLVNTNIIRVHLDNDLYVDCTPDHRFMMRDAAFKEAQYLVSGDSLMPLHNGIQVSRIEWLEEKVDTYDITTEKNHNFALTNGIFVHNSLNIDTNNPSYNSKFSAMANIEDIIIPVWGDVNQVQVEKLGGEVDVKWIEDILLLTKQLSTALAIPLPLLAGYAQEANGGIGQNSLEKLDIRFARQARRVQRAVISGLTRLAQIHLAYQGINPDPNFFTIHMSETSTAEELELQDALDKGLDVTGKAMDMFERVLGPDLDKIAAMEYLNEKFLKLSDLELDKIMLKGNPNAFNVPEGEDTLGGGGSTGGSSSFGSAPATGSDSGNPFAEHATTGEDVAGSTEEPSTKPEEGEPNKGDESGTEDKEEENPFHENLNISDLHSLTPLLESRKSWEETWGKTVVKITPTKK